VKSLLRRNLVEGDVIGLSHIWEREIHV
jgi:hypothetical protein